MKVREIEEMENENGKRWKMKSEKGDCVRGNLCTTTPGGKSND